MNPLESCSALQRSTLFGGFPTSVMRIGQMVYEMNARPAAAPPSAHAHPQWTRSCSGFANSGELGHVVVSFSAVEASREAGPFAEAQAKGWAQLWKYAAVRVWLVRRTDGAKLAQCRSRRAGAKEQRSTGFLYGTAAGAPLGGIFQVSGALFEARRA